MTDHPATADLRQHHDVPREARAFQGNAAGIVTRGVAAGTDLVVVLSAGALIWVGAAAVLFIFRPRHFSFPSPTLSLALAVLGVIAWGYLTAGWATSGRTLGNQLLGLRVVTVRERRIRWSVAAVRAVAYIIFPIGLAWSALSSKRRSLQDIVLRTQVIYDWSRRPTR